MRIEVALNSEDTDNFAHCLNGYDKLVEARGGRGLARDLLHKTAR